MPLLAPSPEVVSLYATKSGAKRVFSGADVNIPVGAHDVYDRDELLSALVKLIATNLDVARWIIRIDDDHDCANVAYLDVKALRAQQHRPLVGSTQPQGDTIARKTGLFASAL